MCCSFASAPIPRPSSSHPPGGPINAKKRAQTLASHPLRCRRRCVLGARGAPLSPDPHKQTAARRMGAVWAVLLSPLARRPAVSAEEERKEGAQRLRSLSIPPCPSPFRACPAQTLCCVRRAQAPASPSCLRVAFQKKILPPLGFLPFCCPTLEVRSLLRGPPPILSPSPAPILPPPLQSRCVAMVMWLTAAAAHQNARLPPPPFLLTIGRRTPDPLAYSPSSIFLVCGVIIAAAAVAAAAAAAAAHDGPRAPLLPHNHIGFFGLESAPPSLIDRPLAL